MWKRQHEFVIKILLPQFSWMHLSTQGAELYGNTKITLFIVGHQNSLVVYEGEFAFWKQKGSSKKNKKAKTEKLFWNGC